MSDEKRKGPAGKGRPVAMEDIVPQCLNGHGPMYVASDSDGNPTVYSMSAIRIVDDPALAPDMTAPTGIVFSLHVWRCRQCTEIRLTDHMDPRSLDGPSDE